MGQWIYRLDFVVAVADLPAAYALGEGIDPTVGPGNSLIVPLWASGTPGVDPETHRGASTGLTAAQRSSLKAALDAGALPSCRYYLLDEDTRLLVETNVATAAGRVGSAWRWADALADLALATDPGN